jgi:hypothetical protein
MKITKNIITVPATGSRLKVLSSDAPSAYGLRPDWIALDELAEWKKRDLWDSLWSATGKRPRCRVLVISSAGWDRTGIAWEVRQIAEKESDWYFSSRGQCASWIRPAWLDQQRRTLPVHVFARLHESRWVDGVGAFLTAAEVDSIFQPWPIVYAGSHAIGLDIGISRDRTVISILQRDVGTGLVIVDGLITWTPQKGERIDLQQVEDELVTLAQNLRCPIYPDPWQGIFMAQRLRAKGLDVIEYPFTPDNRRKLFGNLLDLIRANRLRSRMHDTFRRELLGLEVQEASTGWRVDHKPGGHDDHVVAVALAIQGVGGIGIPTGSFQAFGQLESTAWGSPFFQAAQDNEDSFFNR